MSLYQLHKAYSVHSNLSSSFPELKQEQLYETVKVGTHEGTSRRDRSRGPIPIV